MRTEESMTSEQSSSAGLQGAKVEKAMSPGPEDVGLPLHRCTLRPGLPTPCVNALARVTLSREPWLSSCPHSRVSPCLLAPMLLHPCNTLPLPLVPEPSSAFPAQQTLTGIQPPTSGKVCPDSLSCGHTTFCWTVAWCLFMLPCFLCILFFPLCAF